MVNKGEYVKAKKSAKFYIGPIGSPCNS